MSAKEKPAGPQRVRSSAVSPPSAWYPHVRSSTAPRLRARETPASPGKRRVSAMRPPVSAMSACPQ
eukprot:2321356-Pleurochrysis_carterae.AAC.1